MRSSVRLLLLFLPLAAACDRDAADRATGTIETTDVDLGAEGAGRLVTLRVREGELVRAGDTVARVAVTTLPADLERQEAALRDARAQLADLRAGARGPELARARAEIDRAIADSVLAEATRRRIEPLAARGDVAAQQGDEVRAAARQATARLAGARESLALLQAGARPDAIRAGDERVAQAEATLAALRARQGDLVLVAPMAGRVRATWFEPGELVPAGRAVLTIADETHPWVRVYVGPEAFARVRPGQVVRARFDFGGAELAGRVVALSDRAEFTPRVALTEDERADLTFWVKVALDDTTGRAKAGLPVTVTFDGGRP